MRLLLVRHGQTTWNTEGRAQGHTDIGLDEVGLAQATCLAHAIASDSFGPYSQSGVQVWSSDLRRASQTAELIADKLALPVRKRTELRERSFGAWEGMNFKEMAEKSIRKSLSHSKNWLETKPDGGESFRDVWNRLTPISAEIDETPDNLIVVTHGGAGAVLLAQLVRGTLETSRAFRFSNTGVMELERRPEGLYVMLRYNDDSHCGLSRDTT